MIRKSVIFLALLLGFLLLISPANAMAKGIFEHQNTVVPANQSVDNVVAVGGDVTIQGNVKDSVVVLNGDVSIKASAKINGSVIVIGGKLQQEQGAVIADEVMNISLDTATQNSFMFGGGLVVGTWLLQLAASVLFVIPPVLTVFLSKRRLEPHVDRVRQSPGYPLYIGFFTGLILIAVTMLLFVSVVGIPLAIILLIFVVVSFIYGLALLSILTGEKIQGIFGRSNWIVSLAGSVLLVSFMNVPLIGGILFLGVMFFSIGITTLWMLGKFKRISP